VRGLYHEGQGFRKYFSAILFLPSKAESQISKLFSKPTLRKISEFPGRFADPFRLSSERPGNTRPSLTPAQQTVQDAVQAPVELFWDYDLGPAVFLGGKDQIWYLL
jgi:hypothetical protein